MELSALECVPYPAQTSPKTFYIPAQNKNLRITGYVRLKVWLAGLVTTFFLLRGPPGDVGGFTVRCPAPVPRCHVMLASFVVYG